MNREQQLEAALREMLRTHEAESESAEDARFVAEELLRVTPSGGGEL